MRKSNQVSEDISQIDLHVKHVQYQDILRERLRERLRVRSCNATKVMLILSHGKTIENRIPRCSLSYNIQRQCKREHIS